MTSLCNMYFLVPTSFLRYSQDPLRRKTKFRNWRENDHREKIHEQKLIKSHRLGVLPKRFS